GVAYLEEGVGMDRRAGRLHSVADSLAALSEVAWRMGDYVRARQSAEESLVLSEQLALRMSRAAALSGLGAALQQLGELERAEEVLTATLTLAREMGEVQ